MVFPSTMNGGTKTTTESTYDRKSDLKAFDDTKTGVKGLADAGIKKLPPIFVCPPELSDTTPINKDDQKFQIPIIDLGGVDEDPVKREEIVGQIEEATLTWGFFQVVNHGIPIKVLEGILNGTRFFHEQETEIKKQYYSRDFTTKKVLYMSNFDLYTSPVANWRDTLLCHMAPNPPQPEDLPVACRDIMMEYSKHVSELGASLLRLLSETLGLSSDRLIEMECATGLVMLCQYYPPCPEPEKTIGAVKHTDNGFITVLLQDNFGGLQVLHQNQWFDVPPTPGALVVNIGDLMQLLSNDKFKSVAHRVVANKAGPRISVASFFSNISSSRVFGPLKEVVSEDNPPKYRPVTSKEYYDHYRAKGLGRTPNLLHFAL